MKIQCGCGAKIEFDLPSDTAPNPVQVACPSCGQDISNGINELIRQQAAAATSPPMAVPLPGVRAPIRVAVAPRPSAETPASPAVETEPVAIPCSRHGMAVVERCRVCQKPICPRCMEMFGYVCSVPCRDAAAKAGLRLPEYEHLASRVRARTEHKARRVIMAVAAVVVVMVGVWAWYSFFASKPRVASSIRFPDDLDDGEVKLVPPADVLVRRGARLARYELASKKPVWAIELPGASDWHWHVRKHDVWVATRNKLVRHDWRTGAPAREVPLPGPVTLFFGDESSLSVLVRGELGKQFAVRLNLDKEEAQQEEIVPLNLAEAPSAGNRASRAPVTPGVGAGGSGPAPVRAARAIGMLGQRPLPDEDAEVAPEAGLFDASRNDVVGGAEALVQLGVKLLEAKTVMVQAMKPAPARSALDGPVNAAATVAIINETLNESQRERTGGVQREDASRYQVTLKRLLENGAGWTGEVSGAPEVFPLNSMDLLVAGKSLMAFDRSGQHLWKTTLAYPVPELNELDPMPTDDLSPAIPAVQRGNSLYVFDLGVLTAFEATTGNVRWRLPSVGITGLRFDESGALYVNTTDADQDVVKFQQQVDVERRVRSLILKVEAATGRILWRARNVGQVARMTGGFLYAVEWAGGSDRTRARPHVASPHVRVHRLNPENGLVIWEYYQGRQPIALDIHRNTIEILFRNELQTVRFTSF